MEPISTPISPGTADELKMRLEGSPFWRSIGLKIDHMQPGRARLSLPITDTLHQVHGTVHGGIMATLIDAAVGAAALLHAEGEVVVTTDLNISYLAPGTRGTLYASGEILQVTQRFFFGQARIESDTGQLLASGRATYYRYPPR